MKIAFNPSTVAALIAPPNNKDITFDLRGHNIFARGVKFCGTDTNTWRPVVDNLTSDSTTSSLSANQGRILKALIDGKSDSDHNHDDRYLRLTGGTMASNALITFADSGSRGTDKGPQGARGGLYWTGQSDYAKLYAEETAGDNLDLVIQFGDDNSNGLSIRNNANIQTSYISSSGVIITGTFKGNLDWSYITNKPSSFTPSAHTHSWTSITDKLVAGNEFNIIDSGFNGDMWFNYLPINNRDSTATVLSYHFGNGHQGLALVQASGFIKNGSSSSYVLLGDGGHQTISSLSVNYANRADSASNLRVYQYLSNTDTTWWPLIWGGSSHNNTSASTGKVYKSHKVLSWQTSSQTLYATHLRTTDLNTQTALFHPDDDSTLKIYSGRTQNAVSDGHIGLQTSIDGTDGQTHVYPTQFSSRCVLALQPRGGSVYIGNMPNGGNGRKLNVNGDIGLFNVGSIRDLTIGGGMYWNPYVESASDGSDAASITLVKSGVAGGTTLVLSQMNGANDTIQFQTNDSARLYHNSYPILTTQNTYVSGNKGYINNTEITQVNNADTVDYYHADSLFRDLGWWAESETHDANDITGNGAVFAYRNHSNVPTRGVLVTFRGGSDGYRWQMAKSYGNRTLYIRQRNGDNGIWSNWLRLLDESDLTWDNIAGKPSSYIPSAHTHTVFNNNLMIKGTNGVSDSASIHLGIGDSDTGFKWISDGKCQIYANNTAVGEWTQNGMNWFINPTVNGNKIWNAGNDGSGSGLDADTVDGYHASDFASSSHSHNYAANENYGGFTKSGRLPISGFYQSHESESGDNAPWSSWMHLINCQHSNTDYNFALQIAASCFDNNTFKIRVTNNNVNNTWRDIIHSGNIGSQTVANAYHLRINSADTWSTWYWAGQSGQPSWLWGSNDGTNMYVWNPNNFNVHTAQYLRSLGNQNCQTGRTQNYGDVYSYNTIHSNTGAPTDYTSVIGFGRGIGGTVEIAGGWCNTSLYWRSLRDCCEDWYSWRTVLDSSNYTGYVDNYYWANVKISTSSNTQTQPSVNTIYAGNWFRSRGDSGWYNESYGGGIWMHDSNWIKTYGGKSFYCDKQIYSSNSIKMSDILLEHTNEINSASGIHLNYRNSGDVSLCVGGGNVGIGTRYPPHKLYVLGDTYTKGFGINPYYLSDSGLLPTISLSDGYTYRCLEIGKSTKISCIIADRVPLSGSIRGVLLNFQEGFDGQIVLLKDLENYGKGNGYFWVMPSGCTIIRSDSSGTYISYNQISNAYDDGWSRFFVYSSKYKRWIEFCCG